MASTWKPCQPPCRGCARTRKNFPTSPFIAGTVENFEPTKSFWLRHQNSFKNCCLITNVVFVINPSIWYLSSLYFCNFFTLCITQIWTTVFWPWWFSFSLEPFSGHEQASKKIFLTLKVVKSETKVIVSLFNPGFVYIPDVYSFCLFV